MKTAFFLFFLLPVTCLGQNYNFDYLYLPVTNGVLKYEAVVEAPGMSSEKLFQNAKLWFLESFQSTKDVISFEDDRLGAIAGNGIFTIYSEFMGRPIDRQVYFSVRIEVKENRFRYSISDLTIGPTRYPVINQIHPKYLFKKNGKPVESEWKFAWSYEEKIEALEDSIKRFIPKVKPDDW